MAPGFDLEHTDTPFIDEDRGVINPARTEELGHGFICPCFQFIVRPLLWCGTPVAVHVIKTIFHVEHLM